jgi:hypothetical protein
VLGTGDGSACQAFFGCTPLIAWRFTAAYAWVGIEVFGDVGVDPTHTEYFEGFIRQADLYPEPAICAGQQVRMSIRLAVGR